MQFPVTIATVPFRIPNSPQQPTIHYGNCVAKQFQSDLKSPLQLMPISSCVRNGFYQFSDYFREIDGAPAISRPFAAIKVTARSLMHRRLTVDRNNATRFLFFSSSSSSSPSSWRGCSWMWWRTGLRACGGRSLCGPGIPIRPSLRRWFGRRYDGRRPLSTCLRLRQLVTDAACSQLRHQVICRQSPQDQR